MKIDLTVTISVILALAAILSPIFVSIINNKYQLKIKRMENYEIAKKKALENFAKEAGKYIAANSHQQKVNMFDSLYGLIPYFKFDLAEIKTIANDQEKHNVTTQRINNFIEEIKEQL